MRQEATSQSDLINMGPRQQRPRGKRCTGAEVLEGISVQRAATCSVGMLFQRRGPHSPKLAVPTSSATDILKLSGRGTGASRWDVVCQHSTWHSVLAWTRTTEQHTRVLQSLRHQQKAIFQLCSAIQLLDLLLSPQAPSDPPQHIYYLENIHSNPIQCFSIPGL